MRALAALAVLTLGCGAEDMAMGDGLRGTLDDPRYGAVQQAAQVCADGPTVFGIDVSKWQGNIDWPRVAGADVRYAFIRVSDGLNTIDEKFTRNWAGARENGVLRGAYQFFRPGQSAVDQAALLVRRIREEGPMDLPPVIDVEATDGQGADAIARGVRAWIDHVQRELGVAPILYTGKYFWQDNVGNDRGFRDHLLWHAQYTAAACPNIADAWDDWGFWQYTSSGRVAGINGNVDENRFNGDMAALAALVQDGGPVGPAWAGRPRGQSFPLAADPPIELCVGETLDGFMRVDNIGHEAWDDTVRLAPTPRDVPSPIAAADWISPTRVTAADGVVEPGAEARFHFEIRGNEPGRFDQTFGLVAEGATWFADAGGPADDYLELVVEVSACDPAPDAGVVGDMNGPDPADAGVPDVAPPPDAHLTVSAPDTGADMLGLEPEPPRSMDGGAPDGAVEASGASDAGCSTTPNAGAAWLLALAALRRRRRGSGRQRLPDGLR